MNDEHQLTIGLFGFGVVGEGIYQVLAQTPSLNARIKKICIKHPEKKRAADASLFTTQYNDILLDPEINTVIELIDDAGEAYKIVSTALEQKKAVVSANKKMIAENLGALRELQERFGTPLLYEAAVCGSIPVIRNLEEYYDNDLLASICGIVNGSTNFILTKIFEEGLDYTRALLLAQQEGFAESDPSLDVAGIDAVNKLTILLLHGYGIRSHPSQLFHLGISRLQAFDAQLGGEKGLQVKLTAQIKKLSTGKVAAFVMPQFITAESQLYTVRNEYNGVVLQSSFADKQFLYGKGAGRYPTSSAVLSDLSALRYRYQYAYRKAAYGSVTALTDDFYLRLYVSFVNQRDVEQKNFVRIDEFYCGAHRGYLIGVIHFETLRTASWLQDKTVSVIVCPDGILETIHPSPAQKKRPVSADAPALLSPAAPSVSPGHDVTVIGRAVNSTNPLCN